MKVVILAGGLGSRLSEETELKPKPMVEIGGKPILWHIMKIYSYYGFNEFIICCGYKGHLIKEYFANYFLHNSDITVDIKKNQLTIHDSHAEPWKITLVDTGPNTMTGGRIKRIQKYVEGETFMATYGDGVGSIDIAKLVEFHKSQKRIATVTTVLPPGRFGALKLSPDELSVSLFQEKPRGDGGRVNGGFFVFEPDVFKYLQNDETKLEQDALEQLAKAGQLSAFKHEGFWKPMDTLRDKMDLEQLYQSGTAPWIIWKT